MIKKNPKKIDAYRSVYNASGLLDAEMMKNYLESFGIESILIGESIGQTYGLTLTPAGKVEVLVRKEKESKAKELIQEYIEGSSSKG